MVHMLLNFAQFEREMIANAPVTRCAQPGAKGSASAGISFWVTTSRPREVLSSLIPTEAEQVRAIFGLYLELGSLIPVVEELERRECE